MNPQLSSFGSELELNDVRETIQQLLRWGWKYNKNLEEQAAQLHMLIGWSQVVEVYTFFYLFHITPLQNFSSGLVSVFLDTYQLHVFSVLFPPLIASLGLCIEKTFSSWKSSWNFVPVSLPITIRASLPPYSGILTVSFFFTDRLLDASLTASASPDCSLKMAVTLCQVWFIHLHLYCSSI